MGFTSPSCWYHVLSSRTRVRSVTSPRFARSARQRGESGTAAPIGTSPLLHPLPARAGRGRTVGSGGPLPLPLARAGADRRQRRAATTPARGGRGGTGG